MRAAVYHTANDVRILDLEPVAPGPGDVGLEIALCGICATDAREFTSGPISMASADVPHPVSGHSGPIVMGHEFVGRVFEVGDGVSPSWIGQRVASSAAAGCGKCAWCRSGRQHHCSKYVTFGLSLNGGMAERCVVPVSACVRLDGVPFETAVLAQPMSIALHAMHRSKLREGEQVGVVGFGGIGSLIAYAAGLQGSSVTTFELDEQRLAIAASMGVNPVHVSSGASSPSILGFDVVFEASGTETGLDLALNVVGRAGRVVIIGGGHHEHYAMDTKLLRRMEIDLVGTIAHGGTGDIARSINILSSRSSGWSDVVGSALALESMVEEGLRPLAEGRQSHIKTVVYPSAQ